MATAQSFASISSKRPVKTALHQAVLDCRIHQVRLLVDKHGGNVDSRDVYGRTPLMLACLLENESLGMKMLRIFMKAGAYLNVKDNLNRTAFHYACMKGREAITELLIKEVSVEVNVPDNDGNTALMLAALSGRPKIVGTIVEKFVEFGLSTDARNGLGYTALMLACKYGNYVSANILLNQGQAQPSLRDNEFYFNAQEWVQKSSELSATFALSSSLQRSQSTLDMPRFSREHTVYHTGSASPMCHHSSTPVHPLGPSLNTTFRLPAIFSDVALDKPQESILDGCDARLILLKSISDVINNNKVRPQSQVSSMFARSMTSFPSTAKLRQRSHRVMFPDINTIFRLYSEQQGSRPKDPESASNYLRYGEEGPCHLQVKNEALPDILIQVPTPAPVME